MHDAVGWHRTISLFAVATQELKMPLWWRPTAADIESVDAIVNAPIPFLLII